jgi:hypothetical protein
VGVQVPLGHRFTAYLLDLTYWWSSALDHPIPALVALSTPATETPLRPLVNVDPRLRRTTGAARQGGDLSFIAVDVQSHDICRT